jgi:hypothetical protein
VALIDDHQVWPWTQRSEPGGSGLEGHQLAACAGVGGAIGPYPTRLNPIPGESRSGVYQQLLQVGQEPHAATSGNDLRHSIGGEMGFTESGRCHDDRRTGASVYGRVKIGEGLELIWEQGHQGALLRGGWRLKSGANTSWDVNRHPQFLHSRRRRV